MMSTAEILYTSNVDYLELTDETIEDAKERFKSFKEAGVILSESSWEDLCGKQQMSIQGSVCILNLIVLDIRSMKMFLECRWKDLWIM